MQEIAAHLAMSDATSFSLAQPNTVWKHALATPLTVLRFAIETAHQHPTNQKIVLPHLAQALNQLEYVTSLLYRPQNQPWQMKGILKSTVQRLDCQTGNRVKFIDTEQQDVTFTSHALDFQEALSCAITNAWEAYQEDAYVVVHLSLYQKSDTLILQIQDFGQGMTPYTLQRIIGKGRSTKSSHRGIGTQFIRQVIENQLGGRIMYSSRLGVGTTQTWLIPLPDNDTHTL